MTVYRIIIRKSCVSLLNLIQAKWNRHLYFVLKRNVMFFISVAALFLLTFTVILPLLCKDWPYSKYFSARNKNKLEERALKENSNRILQAEKYLTKMRNNATLSLYKKINMASTKHNVDLSIGVVTVKRTHPSYKLGYLTQVVTQLNKILNRDIHFPETVLFICNTDAGPGVHEEARMLSAFFRVQERFPRGNVSATIMNRFEKEKQDYNYCLKEALSYKPKYIIIVEDDALPRDNLLDVLIYILTDLIVSKYDSQNWAYLKLFYPERWKGFAFETRRLMELTAIGALGGTIFLLIFLVHKRRQPSELEIHVVFTIGAIYFILFAFMFGRVYLIEWRRLSNNTYTVVPAPDCCSPAILYTANMAERISKYFDKVKCTVKFPIDFAMDTFAQLNNYARFLVEPNLIRHIGMYSSLKNKNIKPAEFIFS